MSNFWKDLGQILLFLIKVVWSWIAIGIIGLIVIWAPLLSVWAVVWLARDCEGVIGKILALPVAVIEGFLLYYLFKFIFKGWRPWNDNRHEGFGPW